MFASITASTAGVTVFCLTAKSAASPYSNKVSQQSSAILAAARVESPPAIAGFRDSKFALASIHVAIPSPIPAAKNLDGACAMTWESTKIISGFFK